MLHILYKTTNNINKKVYIGVHSTNDPTDGYLGSGHVLNNAIQKYGRENFTRETISVHKTRKEVFKAESKIVNKKWIGSKSNYNICVGGSGRCGPNSRSKTVCVYDNDLKFIKSFETKIEVARFIDIDPALITYACKNASQNKSCKLREYYVCHQEDQPRKKDTSYLKKQLKIMHERNQGKRRPDHSEFIRKRNLDKLCNHIIYAWNHISGTKFIGTRRDLIRKFPIHKIKNSELGALIKGRYKSHRGWSSPNTISKYINVSSP